MRAGDDERRINYEWPNQLSWPEIKENVLIQQQIPSQRKSLKWNGQIQIQNQPCQPRRWLEDSRDSSNNDYQEESDSEKFADIQTEYSQRRTGCEKGMDGILIQEQHQDIIPMGRDWMWMAQQKLSMKLGTFCTSFK